MPVRPYNDSTSILNGMPIFLGVIDATTTSKTNHEATTPFNNTGEALKGKTLLIQVSAECYIGVTSTSTGTVTTANGVKLAADERVIIMMGQSRGFLAAIHATATANVRVWELV